MKTADETVADLQDPEQSNSANWWLACWGETARLADGDARKNGAPSSVRVQWTAPQGRALHLLADAERSLPAHAQDDSCVVIFDGVLYDGVELLKRCEGVTDPAGNDARVILQAYHRWDEDLLHQIKGIFALIIWDRSRELLLCVRDRVGIYPLFYAANGQELLFSTKIPALLRRPGVSRAVNRAALADHLCRRWPKLEETYYAAVSRVPPAHVLRLDRSGRRHCRYWDPVPPGTEVNWVRENELEQFDELLEQAVNRCLGLGPAGIYLSGGLDSVSVAAVAADGTRRQGLADPLALSLVFPHPDCNEEATQRRVAADLGLPQVLAPFDEAVGAQGLLLSALHMSSQRPAPLLNYWNPAYLYLGRQGRRRGCQVILTGTGGDEWLLVSPYLAADLMRSLNIVGLYQLCSNTYRSNQFPLLGTLRNVLWRFGLRPLLGAAARRLLRAAAPRVDQARGRWRIARERPKWVAPDPALQAELDRRVEESRPTPAPSSLYMREMRTALDHPMVAIEMEEYFENGECLGLRILHPFLDAELIDFLYRVPPAFLNRGGRSKGLVRQMLARRFPDLGFGQHKKVLATSVFTSMMVKEGPGAWQALGGVPALSKLGIVDATALDSALPALFSGGRPQKTFRIWEVLALQAWLGPRL